MVLCVRKDLPMSKGKTCAQCCHAAVGAVNRARRETKSNSINIIIYNIGLYKAWCHSGCKKVALSCPSLEEFIKIEQEAEKAGLVSYAVVI